MLGLDYDKNPSESEIRTAYRKLALKWHPDRNKAPDAKLKFDELKQASVILLTAELRQ